MFRCNEWIEIYIGMTVKKTMLEYDQIEAADKLIPPSINWPRL